MLHLKILELKVGLLIFVKNTIIKYTKLPLQIMVDT